MHQDANPMTIDQNPLLAPVRAVCFDWGGTLMSERGPADIPMAQWPEVALIEGALECLHALEGKVPLAIATNASASTRPMVEAALARVGIARYFSHVFCFTEIGHRKDQAAFWQVVARELAVPLDSVAMVGDSYEQDALGPSRFGVQSVWFNPLDRSQPEGSATPQVQDLPSFSSWVLARLQPQGL
ncbi:HAD family hydrolase [Pseudomonas sp. ABC1]|uniref:HAD family hydrolase n=1 Tax=Pseudomonas sp. ABC1 TaxID=2748080 RepID=UPI0015C3B9F3|nr:HAD family hydrolase [Pseudomonas sp. ABC1]QLF94204.1 HAD family hydrolase [Pseudomonas sp. ABC1]